MDSAAKIETYKYADAVSDNVGPQHGLHHKLFGSYQQVFKLRLFIVVSSLTLYCRIAIWDKSC